MGVAHAATLWQTVKALEPTKVEQRLFRVWGGTMLRSIAVALLLLLALKRSLSAGLWALAGFLIARLVCCGLIARPTAGKKALLPKREVNE